MTDDTVDIDVKVFAKTNDALFVSDTGNKADAEWIPRSQIEDCPAVVFIGEEIEITIPVWIAMEKGFV